MRIAKTITLDHLSGDVFVPGPWLVRPVYQAQGDTLDNQKADTLEWLQERGYSLLATSSWETDYEEIEGHGPVSFIELDSLKTSNPPR